VPQSGTVQVDADRIQLVFANLLTNAIRHSPAGSQVTLRAAPAGDRVRFEVSDAGPGIPIEHHQSIFEKHFQLPGISGGAGLGLFIAREIVQAHGGQIEIAAPGEAGVPEVGTTFRFYLPVAA
jgi:two-component system, NtrC family, sensor histidine kinase KinB